MSCLGGFLTDTATVYNIDFSNTTGSGQPIETLSSPIKTIRCLLTDDRRKAWHLYDPGQIKDGEFVFFSIKTITVNQVVEVNSVKYRVVNTKPVRPFKHHHIMGYQSFLEFYKH